ncbi:N-acetylmuramoyl-L-alanine amidase family protein [Candidatus Magnetominusculus xianensis]|uniref:N-acetylmuramoyl-L-alanine amidase n=1 Tax=Candidatus Magnetominusculus xianensis TaxID=1748249 RepID=A0ABR5SCW8_9BACT|nr:N-acetylmuramoyl-L-alanine amidase [Candidatus Magnetominusculus xianensis]KWT82467.1 N-acetylmuramoyl-L-alanine amidase [Candidatus Magnetominusculus xianensis]MBF0403187.1 N-acetylmuramoyl-L-alanine amidase [Nitrospirota bacterium]
MTNSYVMKNAGMFILIFIALSSSGAYGTDAGQIVMQFSQKNNILRFVFQSTNDSLISSSKVNESYSIVRVDFQSDFLFNGTPLPEAVKVIQKDKSIYLNIRNLEKINVSRYAGPPRLVIEAVITGALPLNSPVPAQTNEFAGLSILLDAGHGGIDTGIISGQFKESALSLSVCADLAKRIGSKVRRTAITRKDDSAMPLSQRIIDIRKFRPNLFISIHVSTSDTFAIYTSSFPAVMSGPDMAYSTAYTQASYIEKSRTLSKAIGSALNEKFKTQPVYREVPIPILSATSAPAVMIEMPNPASFTYTNDSINTISDAIIRAISDYAKK